MDKKYYTYIHTRNDTNSVFYVGKGSGQRYLWKYKRNNLWEKIVNKHGYTAHIVAYWNTEEEAFIHERELIKKYREEGLLLANFTDGGDGASGYRFTEEQRRNLSKSVKSWYAIPENYAKLSVIRKQQWTEKARKKAAKSSKTVWTADQRKKHSEKLKETYSSDEMKTVQANKNRNFRESKEGKEFFSQRMKDYWKSEKANSEDEKMKRSEARKKSWETRRQKNAINK
jgi:hypothetical protein